jgi:hypothetical protein
MSNKQTSVEWLAQQLLNAEPNVLEWQKYLLQAKQLHKQEIIKANRDGVDMAVDKKPFITGEQYYQETYVDKLGNEDVPKLGYDADKISDEEQEWMDAPMGHIKSQQSLKTT